MARNYIETLQDDRARLMGEVADLETRIRDLHIYLSSPKFWGPERSTVEVADVLHRLGVR